MTAGITEQAVVFDCHGEQLIGIASLPALPAARGVLIVVGGPQYRVGSHRQFVLLARRLAESGFAAFRFDYRGMGDAGGAQRSFEAIGDDLRHAGDAFQSMCPTMREIVVWGLCDGASAALMFATEETRYAALVLVNPWVRTDVTMAKTHLKHYYLSRLLQGDLWRRILRREFSWRKAFGSAAGTLSSAMSRSAADDGYIGAMRRGLDRYQGRLLIVLSGNDLTAREFEDTIRADPAWRASLGRKAATWARIPDADHTFSNRAWRIAAEDATLTWLGTW